MIRNTSRGYYPAQNFEIPCKESRRSRRCTEEDASVLLDGDGDLRRGWCEVIAGAITQRRIFRFPIKASLTSMQRRRCIGAARQGRRLSPRVIRNTSWGYYQAKDFQISCKGVVDVTAFPHYFLNHLIRDFVVFQLVQLPFLPPATLERLLSEIANFCLEKRPQPNVDFR